MESRQGVYIDEARPASKPGALQAFWAAPFLVVLRDQLLRERDRWSLWLPVALGAGMALYFGMSSGPLLWPWGAAGALFCGLAFYSPSWRMPALAALCLCLGVLAAGWRVERVHTPMMERPLVTNLEGRVMRVEPHARGLRLTLDQLTIDRIAPDRRPERVRLIVNRAPEGLVVGAVVGMRARLEPAAGPSMPGAFDFSRWSYFRQIGAVGRSLGPVVLLAEEAPNTSLIERFIFALRHQQQILTRHIQDRIGGEAGAISAALMTGERGGISNETEQAFRDSGLTHILSISGMHLSLVAGFVFFGLRSLLALWPYVALNYPIKKWAAWAAIAASAGYMLLSGAAIPTQRAFLMTTLLFLGIVMDREAVSMRSIAWAAVAILILMPESVMDAGFQMSFAAVAALVALYESHKNRFQNWRRDAGFGQRLIVYLGLLVATSLIAGLVTAPFSAWHFQRMANYGLLANAVAMPLASFVTMPMAVLAFLLMPFGAEGWALWLMGQSVDVMIAVAYWVAALPGATVGIPATPVAALLLTGFGLCWLLIWQTPWRWLGLVPVALACLWPLQVRQPDLLIDAQMRFIAVRDAEGLRLSARRGGGFVGDAWRQRMNLALEPWPMPGEEVLLARGGKITCQATSCFIEIAGRSILWTRQPETAAQECGRVDYIIADFPVWRFCRPGGRSRVIDRLDTRRDGAMALWLAEGEVVATRALRGDWPWVLPRPRRPSS